MIRALSFALAVVVAAGVSSRAAALPLYASREGKTCVTCHYDPNGGGMRNDFGFLYGKNRHGLDTEAKWSKITVDPRLNEWVAIGVDTRLLYVAAHEKGGTTISTSTFVPMQGQLNVAVTPTDYLSVVMSRGISIDSDQFQARELYGLIHDLPHSLYAKLGRFRLPFGLRQDDHTSYIRQDFLPYNSQGDDAGVEIGAAGSRYFGQLAFTNGSGTASADRAQTFSAKLGLASRPISAGISGFHQYQETTKITHDRWGVYAMSSWQKFTVLGEAGAGTMEAPLFFGGTQNMKAAFAEADYRVSRGVNVRGKFDWFEPNDFTPDSRRYAAEVDIVPVPFTEVKLAFRHHDEVLEFQEYLVQFYFPF